MLGCVAAGITLATWSMHLRRLPLQDVARYRARAREQFHADYQDTAIKAKDGVDLKAWFIEPPEPNGKAVIILHGITANGTFSTGYAEMFLAEGYSVLLPDSRDHGESGGEFATYGVLEREDVARWVSWVRKRASGCTYLLGESMGAAVGLQATSVTSQLCAVAVEDPYFTFREIGYERLARVTHLGTFFWKTAGRPVLEVAYLYPQLRYGTNLLDAEPKYAVEHSQVPALLIAGTKDENIPMHHAQELEAVCASHCSLWIVPGADHGGASTVAHAEFQRRILAWFSAHRAEVSSGPSVTRTSAGPRLLRRSRLAL